MADRLDLRKAYHLEARMTCSLTRSFTAMMAALLLAVPALAQDLTSRPIRIIVGFSAGGATDSVARVYAERMGRILGTPVIVENKPGAAQLAAVKTLLAAPADGHTLYLGTGSSLAQGPGMRTDLPYDPLKDFALIGLVATTPGVIIVSPELPVKSVQDLLDYGKAHPDTISYGSAGFGTASHLQTEYLMSLTGAKWTHVSYKSDSEVVREVSAGRIQISISTTQQSMPLISAGRLKALAVTTAEPLAYLPGVATLPQTGIKGIEGINPYTFYGLVAPVGTPPAIITRLNAAINEISAMPDIATRMRDVLFAEPRSSSPESFRAFMENDIAKWRSVGSNVKLPQ
jgi:tripartite-type tricarboxylate transporter receptor subunit TctC